MLCESTHLQAVQGVQPTRLIGLATKWRGTREKRRAHELVFGEEMHDVLFPPRGRANSNSNFL